MTGEQCHKARFVSDARGGHRLRQFPGLHPAQARQGLDHRLRGTHQARRTGIGTKFALARKPRDDHRCHEAKDNLTGNVGHVITDTGTGAVILENHAVYKVPDDFGQKHHKGIEYALNQRKRHHIAVDDVSNFVREHRFDFFFRHRLQQARGNGNQRRILEGASGKCIWITLENGDFRHADVAFICEATHCVKQPLFGFIARTDDHLRAGTPFGHRLGDK